jgi:hypothetical protein
MFIETGPHSELIICDKYREQTPLYFTLLLSSAFSHVQTSTMTDISSSYEEKDLTEDEISAELLADILSDVPEDADNDSENDSDSSIIGNKQNKIVHPLPS